jgi:nitric oxide dioxygenase
MHRFKKEGDIIRVSPPFGNFSLDYEAASRGPTVLISGGIGLTPLISMLKTLQGRRYSQSVTWVHGSRSAKVRAFSEELLSMAQSWKELQVILFEDQPEPNEVEGRDYTLRGSVNLKKLDGKITLFTNDPCAHYYVCGPTPLMNAVEEDLLERGIDSKRIHMEKFGTGGVQHRPL